MSGSRPAMREATCPACGHHVAAPFYDGGLQPLATLAWPASCAEAAAMPGLPLDFLRCVDCGHVYNAAFRYSNVPYSEKPNLMFNQGQIWSGYIAKLQRELAESLPDRPTVVEIGYGDGSFLTSLAGLKPHGRYIGFDPNGARTHAFENLSFRQELFDPACHLPELKPDLIISRHVLEHLTNPLGFLQTINFAAASAGIPVRMYFEVPCIDNAIEHFRTVDFYYEHNSQFTSGSFRRMLERSGARIERIGHGYSGEVIHGFVRASARQMKLDIAVEAQTFAEAAEAALDSIRLQLVSLHVSGEHVAIWGGTGKSAAFINRYGLDAERFPTVVDSDREKAGTFVPGTGQVIRYRDYLLTHPAGVVIVPPQWRAADIVREMDGAGISYRQILIEHRGRLIDYLVEENPYREDAVRTLRTELPLPRQKQTGREHELSGHR